MLTIIPDVGDIVQKKSSLASFIEAIKLQWETYSVFGVVPKRQTPTWRVTGWLKKATHESALVIHFKDAKLTFCAREEATHVCGVGGNCRILPLQEIKIVGRVDWDDSAIEQVGKFANKMADGELFF